MTIHGTIRNGRVELDGAAVLPDGLRVEILVPDVAEEMEDVASRRERIRQIFEKLRQRNPFSDIADSVAWQREMREDRSLPGRQ